MENPSIGRIVHYVLAAVDGPVGVHRPAIVISLGDRPGVVNLQYFAAPGDAGFGDPEAAYCAEVEGDLGALPGTWHWPERN